MKKSVSLLSALLALTLLFALIPAVPAAAAEVSRERGDVNGDGRITPYDALLVLRHVVGASQLSEDQLSRASVVSSASAFGTVSVSECVAILKSAAGETEDSSRFSDLSAVYSASSMKTAPRCFPIPLPIPARRISGR